jgi:nucleobase transporter 1/2
VDLEAGRVRPPPNGVAQSDNVAVTVPVAVPVVKDQTVKKRRDSDGVPSTNGQVNPAPGTGTGAGTEQPSQVRRTVRNEEVVDGLVVDDEGFASRHAHMKYELRDSPGLGINLKCFGILISMI